MVAVIGKGGTATATALAATRTTSTMTMTIPRPSSLTSSSSGASVFAALDQQWRWDGNRVAVVEKVGRTAVDRDERDGATRCDDNDNHPYPFVADVVIIWRLRLRGNGMATAAAGRTGAVDAIVQPWWGGEAKLKFYFSRYLYNRKSTLVADQSQTAFGGNKNPAESGGIRGKYRNSCPAGIPAKNSCNSGKKQEFLRPPPKPHSCEKILRKTQEKINPQESWQERFFWSKK